MTEQIEQYHTIQNPENAEKQSVIDLFSVELDATKNDIVPEELETVIDAIMQDPQQPPEQEDQEKIGDLLKEGKITKAITKALDMVFGIFAGSKKKAGLEDFEKYTVDYTTMSDEKLGETIDRLQNKVKQPGLSVHQKLRFTYAFSRAKDEKLHRENANISPFDTLAKNIQPGDVLLMNKDSTERNVTSKISNEGLQQTSNSIRTHIVIVTEVSGNDIEITHATTPVVKTDNLETYLKTYTAVDICTLQQPPASRQKSIDYAHSLIGKPYDNKSAAKQALIGSNTRDDAYNCGELVAESLYNANPTTFDGVKEKTFPSDFLMSNYLQPAYMTTIVS